MESERIKKDFVPVYSSDQEQNKLIRIDRKYPVTVNYEAKELEKELKAKNNNKRSRNYYAYFR